MTAPKPVARPALTPILPAEPKRVRAPKLRYPGTDAAKWNVRSTTGEILAKGLDGFRAAHEAALRLGGTAVRA